MAAIAFLGVMLFPFAAATQSRLAPASTAPRAANADFAGNWVLRTAQDAVYDLALRVDNGDQVVGRFMNKAASKYDGTLSGAARDGKVSFQWVTETDKGSGSISVHTDNTLSGGITYRPPGATKDVYVRWHATRKPR